jgi:hypothetical protein
MANEEHLAILKQQPKHPGTRARVLIRCSISPVIDRLSASASPWPQPVGRSNSRRHAARIDWLSASPRAASATFFAAVCPNDFLMIVLPLF